MSVPIETYILINFIMNFAIIGIVARSRGSAAWRRVAFASAFGALYAVAMKSGWFPQLNWMGAKLALAVITASVAFCAKDFRSLVSSTLMLLGATVFLGGVMSMTIRVFGRSALTVSLGAFAGVASLAMALSFRDRRAYMPEAQLSIDYSGQKAKLEAMIDTGNRLREPLSGLPVIIVEKRALKRMMPEGLDAARPRESLPAGFRLASFDSLGARGEMALFKPDELLVSYGDGWLRAQDIWVGVYPGDIPGPYRAIAPAVIGRIGQTTKSKEKIKHFEGSGGKWIMSHSRR